MCTDSKLIKTSLDDRKDLGMKKNFLDPTKKRYHKKYDRGNFDS